MRKSPRNRKRNGSSTAMTEIAARDGSGSNTSASEGRSRRSDVSRQQILDVAAKLFRARGYTETSLRDIAKLVGMKAGSLYYHFASKEELAAEVLRIGVKKVHLAVAEAVDALGRDADARHKLEVAMAAHLETLLDESDYTSA